MNGKGSGRRPEQTPGAYADGHDRIFGKKPKAPFTCLFCGMPSWVDPSDQSPPPDYCHESDHGEPD